MALEQSRFFNSMAEDPRRYSADNFAEYFRMLFGNGVRDLGDNLAVSPGEIDMSVSVDYGMALIDGYAYWLKDDGTGPWKTTLVSAPLPRFARVVLHLDKRLDQQGIRLQVIYGELATDPQLPPLTRTGAITELSLARIYIPASAVQITAANVVDERDDDELCGRIALKIDAGTEEVDPTVPAWAKQPDKPTYTAAEVGIVLPLGIPDGGHGGTTAAEGRDRLGALAVGQRDYIPSGADFNDYLLPSSLSVSTNAIAATIANIPTASAGLLDVFHTSGEVGVVSAWSYVLQRYTTLNGVTYLRQINTDGNNVKNYAPWRRQMDVETDQNIVTSYYSSYTIQASNTYEVLPLTSTTIIGGKITADTANNRFVVGSGVSHLLVGAGIRITPSGGAGSKYLDIQRNETSIANIYVRCIDTLNYQAISHVPRLVAVSPGDTLRLRVYGIAGDVFNGGILTAEAVR